MMWDRTIGRVAFTNCDPLYHGLSEKWRILPAPPSWLSGHVVRRDCLMAPIPSADFAKYADQLNAFSGYAFAPQDGFSQGLALAVCTLFVPVPMAFVYGMEVLTGLWTLYIHTDVCPLPWPLMGCDYHFIHHRYNWYNFGLFTMFWDWAYGTLKHPDASVDEFAKRLASKGASLDELHQMALKRAAIKARHQARRSASS